jgi:hypothetical protein
MPDLPLTSLASAIPVIAAFLIACAGFVALKRLVPGLWPAPASTHSNRPLIDLGLCLLALAGVVVLRDAYRSGFLLSADQVGWVRKVAWFLDNFMVCSPIFAVLAVRQQGMGTILLSTQALPWKVLVGIALGIAGTFVYLQLRGEAARWPEVLEQICSWDGCADVVLVLFGGIVLAFLIVRLRWALGPAGLAVAALALGCFYVIVEQHEGRAAREMAALFMLIMASTAASLFVVQRSNDVLWAAIVYYFVEAAIRIG